MKLFFALSLGLIASVSALSANQTGASESSVRKSQEEISREMEKKFALRDSLMGKRNFKTTRVQR